LLLPLLSQLRLQLFSQSLSLFVVIPEGDLRLQLQLLSSCHPSNGSAVAVALLLSFPQGICVCSGSCFPAVIPAGVCSCGCSSGWFLVVIPQGICCCFYCYCLLLSAILRDRVAKDGLFAPRANRLLHKNLKKHNPTHPVQSTQTTVILSGAKNPCISSFLLHLHLQVAAVILNAVKDPEEITWPQTLESFNPQPSANRSLVLSLLPNIPAIASQPRYCQQQTKAAQHGHSAFQG
jgi:hypothetical protein